MKRLARCVVACSCCLLTWFSAPGARAGDLSADVRNVLADKLLAKATVGVEIVRLGKSESDVATLYTHDHIAPLTPASNLKVVTTSAALERLGPDFRFRTLLLEHGGDLILVGDGDPTMGDAEMLRKVGWDVDTVFKTWATGLAKRNTTVRNLLIDDSVFDMAFLHPDWPAGQQQKRYVAQVGGLNLNANCLDFYIRPGASGEVVSYTTNPRTDYATVRNTCISGGDNAIWLSRQPGGNDIILRGRAASSNDVPVSVTINDPPMFAGTVLAETLKDAGVSISGDVKRDRSVRAAYAKASAAGDKSWTLLAIHETPLTAVMARANKDSMNLYAECVCKRLGFATRGEGTWANGTAAVAEFLRGIGVSESEFHLDDGCGLSKEDKITAHLMVKVLTHDYFGRNSKAFLDTLAIAGRDGTMKDRFEGTDLRGRVLAKSGFVNGVSSLSGFLHAKDDSWFAFSILINGIPEGTNSGAKALQEKIVKAVDGDCARGQ